MGETVPRGKIIGHRIDPVTRQKIEMQEHEHFVKCDACGGWVDRRDLGIVIAHEGPLPHPSEDREQ